MASKEQQKLLDAIIAIKPKSKIICDYRPDILKNIKTGKNYEIDIYFEKWRIGIEYQGAVHFRNIKRYNNDSDNAKYNDTLKHEMIDKIKGKLLVIEVFEEDLKGDIAKNISKRFRNIAAYYYRHNLFIKYRIAFNMYLAFYYQIGYGFSVTHTHIQIFGENGLTIKRPFDVKKEKDDFWREFNINTNHLKGKPSGFVF